MILLKYFNLFNLIPPELHFFSMATNDKIPPFRILAKESLKNRSHIIKLYYKYILFSLCQFCLYLDLKFNNRHMFILKNIITAFHTKRLKKIEHFRNHPEDVQIDQFKSLIKKAEKTTWGKQYEYSSIRSIDDYRERVPVQDYDGFLQHIIRLRQGEENLLWPGKTNWFAKSSGTTSTKSKFIPISKESLWQCHFQGGRDVLAIYHQNYPNNNLFSGKTLTLGGSHQINNFNVNSHYGDLSAILIENLPFWTQFFRTPSRKVALLDEWEEKLDLITKETIKQNVTALAGVPSWFLVLLRHILDFSGKKNLLEIWPNLELFIHGGVSFTPYRSQYQDLLPSENMHYLETYNASEGFFAIQDEPSSSSMLLMLDYGVFFEFLPLSEQGKAFPKTLTLHQVETDVDYALVISTNDGLWRYLIGDTIRFSSLKPFRIVISGRTRHYINAFGEEVIIDNAEKAIEAACRETGSVIKEYTAAPVYMSVKIKGAHEWLIEFEKEPNDLAKFIEVLDTTLKEQNSDYEAKRYKDITLDMPHVIIAKKGLFFSWLKKKNKIGGQNKVPRLSNTREYMDDLLEMNN